MKRCKICRSSILAEVEVMLSRELSYREIAETIKDLFPGVSLHALEQSIRRHDKGQHKNYEYLTAPTNIKEEADRIFEKAKSQQKEKDLILVLKKTLGMLTNGFFTPHICPNCKVTTYPKPYDYTDDPQIQDALKFPESIVAKEDDHCCMTFDKWTKRLFLYISGIQYENQDVSMKAKHSILSRILPEDI